jgi:hypothetical protein
MILSRRSLIAGLAALCALPATGARAAGEAMRVAKDPNCGCCADWVEIVRAAGFDVTVEEMDPGALQDHKAASGIAPEMASCHTAHVAGYVIEGHVPVADINRLLETRPDAIGLSVPGMPFGSPGMGPEDQREAYSVHLIARDGSTTVFSTYAAA